MNVGTCVAVVRVKEGSRNARRERDWGERKFTGRTIPGVGVISFSTGEARGRSSVPRRERLGGKICDSVCFEIRARQKNWVGRRYGGALAGALAGLEIGWWQLPSWGPSRSWRLEWTMKLKANMAFRVHALSFLRLIWIWKAGVDIYFRVFAS